MNRRCLIPLVLSLSGAVVAQPTFSAQRIFVNGVTPTSVGLSDGGWVAGSFSPSQFRDFAFRWRQGASEVLSDDAVGTPVPFAEGGAINSRGVAAGEAGVDLGYHPAFWDESGAYHRFETFGGYGGGVRSINELNWMVGNSKDQQNLNRPFLYRNGDLQDMGSLGINEADQGLAFKVNENGMVLGQDWDEHGETTIEYNWYWTEASGMVRVNQELRMDLNDLGDAPAHVGSQWGWLNLPTGQFHALSGATNVMYLNNRHEAVGTSSLGVTFWQNDIAYSLQSLLADPYTNLSVQDMNNDGQILARGRQNGTTYSILLTPVPEPASLAALGLGALLLSRRKRR